jgi:outer membrane lipoprotein-sorting protein
MLMQLFRFFHLILILIGCCLISGCWERSAPPKPTPELQTNSETNYKNNPTNTNTATPKNSDIADQPLNPPNPPADQTPQQLLEKTVTVYKSASSYSDHGEVRIIGKMTNSDAEPSPWLCTIAFQSPNKLRIEVNEGKLVSDGEDCFAQIRPLPNQVLRFPTPNYWSLDVLFQDVFLDQAMDLGLPDTILRFPPQLILLFADSPLKTLLPEGSETEFLDPQWIGETPCDVIRVNHSEGNRLLWISRTNQALLRFDYYVEGLPVPQGFESIQLIRIDLSDAQFNYNITPEAFQMQQPQDAQPVSEFQPTEIISADEKKPENPLAVLAKMREEHRKELRLMSEKDYYATIPPQSETTTEKSVQPDPPKSPTTFTLKELWKQPLAGAGNITVMPSDSGVQLFIPCEGNFLAVFDLSGKLLQKFKPEGLHNDELLTLLRTGTDESGKRYIAISSVGGNAVHVFDDSLKPVFAYSPDTVEGVKLGIADFRFINLHNNNKNNNNNNKNNNAPAMIVGVIALDNGKDSIRVVDGQGKEIWKDDSISSPFQVDSFQVDNNREIICIEETKEQQASLSVYDLNGKRLTTPELEEGRQILWFNVADINGNEQSTIGVLHADETKNDVRFAICDRNGKFLGNQPLPSGEYHQSMEQIITGDIVGDSVKEWIVPSPHGTVFVFDRNGNTLDSFSFGKFLTGLTVVSDKDGKRVLVITDNESVTAFSVVGKE